MAERLSLYDYLSFVLPGATILFVAIYGYDGWPRAEPGAAATLGLVAGAFVIGYLNAAIGNWIEAVFLGSRPGARPDPLWGTLTGKSRYSADEQKVFEETLHDRYGEGVPLRTCYRLAYTELQQRELAGQLHVMNQHIGFSRGMATACGIAFAIEAGLAATVGSHLEAGLWLPLLGGASIAFVSRYRRFWAWFGDNVLRGTRLLPLDTS
jgi:hypothetical protein